MSLIYPLQVKDKRRQPVRKIDDRDISLERSLSSVRERFVAGEFEDLYAGAGWQSRVGQAKVDKNSQHGREKRTSRLYKVAS